MSLRKNIEGAAQSIASTFEYDLMRNDFENLFKTIHQAMRTLFQNQAAEEAVPNVKPDALCAYIKKWYQGQCVQTLEVPDFFQQRFGIDVRSTSFNVIDLSTKVAVQIALILNTTHSIIKGCRDSSESYCANVTTHIDRQYPGIRKRNAPEKQDAIACMRESLQQYRRRMGDSATNTPDGATIARAIEAHVNALDGTLYVVNEMKDKKKGQMIAAGVWSKPESNRIPVNLSIGGKQIPLNLARYRDDLYVLHAAGIDSNFPSTGANTLVQSFLTSTLERFDANGSPLPAGLPLVDFTEVLTT
jgi:hypothetical protein